MLSRLYGRVPYCENVWTVSIATKNQKDQSGFRVGRSCIDNVFCVKQIMKKTLGTGRELHLLFVDFTKSYDNVPGNQLCSVLQETRITKSPIDVKIQELYNKRYM